VVVIGGLLSSTLLAIFVTPSLYTLLDDLQGLVFRTPRVTGVPAERVAVPVPVGAAPVPVAASVAVHNGHGNGSNGANGHKSEPAWLQRLKAGTFADGD
jgi:hypothetical protein